MGRWRAEGVTEGFRSGQKHPSVSRFATATSPFVLRKNGEGLVGQICSGLLYDTGIIRCA